MKTIRNALVWMATLIAVVGAGACSTSDPAVASTAETGQAADVADAGPTGPVWTVHVDGHCVNPWDPSPDEQDPQCQQPHTLTFQDGRDPGFSVETVRTVVRPDLVLVQLLKQGWPSWVIELDANNGPTVQPGLTTFGLVHLSGDYTRGHFITRNWSIVHYRLYELETDAVGTITKFAADIQVMKESFSQQPLTVAVRAGSDVPIPETIDLAQSEDPSVPKSQLALTAQDYLVGEGGAWVLDGRAGYQFSVTENGDCTHLAVNRQAGSTEFWYVDMCGGPLALGSFAPADPNDGTAQPLSITGDGRGCHYLINTGYDVLDLQRDSSGSISSLAVDLRWQCVPEPGAPPDPPGTGSIRVNSTVPLH